MTTFRLYLVLYVDKKFLLHPFLYLLMCLALGLALYLEDYHPSGLLQESG